MTIATTDLLTGIASAIAVLCATGYVREVIRAGRLSIERRIDDVEDIMWREHQGLWNRINDLERKRARQRG